MEPGQAVRKAQLAEICQQSQGKEGTLTGLLQKASCKIFSQATSKVNALGSTLKGITLLLG